MRRDERHLLRFVSGRDREVSGSGEGGVGAKSRTVHPLSGQIHEGRVHRGGENGESRFDQSESVRFLQRIQVGRETVDWNPFIRKKSG